MTALPLDKTVDNRGPTLHRFNGHVLEGAGLPAWPDNFRAGWHKQSLSRSMAFFNGIPLRLAPMGQ